ncbi:MAG: PilZ domain-containing protein [Candidatus Eremiobacteraeota bacterium]|nr:PilZ domain-containing protein [Candidatus Eremiobacteraeota bacterium]
MFQNRRLHRRHEIKAVAKILHGANALELPIRDISMTGIGLDSDAAKALSLGNLCLVVLPEHGKLDAMVVGVRSASYHLQFLSSGADEVRSFIDAHAA